MTRSNADVLVVDDDDDLRSLVAEILLEKGYSIATAANGREALAQLQDGLQASVILLDLMMPEMDGWEFRDAQQRSPKLAAIPVVVFTAHGDAGAAAAKMGAAAGLEKPVDIDDLIAVIARHAGGPGSTTGNP